MLEYSLRRSRSAWFTENLFDVYWTKPTRRKGQPQEPPNNPPSDSMKKIGQCRITIEPHVFHATLFSISAKKSSPPLIQTGFQTDTSYPPRVAYSPSIAPLSTVAPSAAVVSSTNNSIAPTLFGQCPQLSTPLPLRQSPVPPQLSAPWPLRQSPVPQPQVNVTATPPSIQSLPAAPPPVGPAIAATPVKPVSAATASAVLTPITGANPPRSGNNLSAGPLAPFITPSVTPVVPKPPSQDPVIQMLAQRASADPELKVLMKIVAAGNASPQQLKVFQGHIDDLTSILQSQNPTSSFLHMSSNWSTSNGYRPPPSAPSSAFRPSPQTMTFNPHTKFQAAPPVKPKPVALPKDDVVGIAIEFSGSSSERYLFPKLSILETSIDGRSVLASFLILRKRLQEGAGGTIEYHQPVTIRLTAENVRTFDLLYRTAIPLEEARRYMEDIMSRTSRAEDVKLVLQLPKDSSTDENEGSTPVANPLGAAAKRKSSISDDPLPAAAGSSTRKSRKTSEMVDSRCQYCLVVLGPQQRGADTCIDCAMLVREASRGNPWTSREARLSTMPVRQSAGPRTLAFT